MRSFLLTTLVVTSDAFMSKKQMPMPKTIVELAIESGQFTTLVTALGVAGLAEALSGAGPFTVLAPNDDAFAKLPEDTLNGLLADPVALGNILRYHVISGAVDAATAVTLDGQSVPTLADAPDNYIDITVVDGGVVLNGVTNVIQADISGSNGIVHVIDSVLLPGCPSTGCAPATKPMPKTIVELAIASGQFTTLVTALGVAGLADVLSGAGPFTVLAPTDDAFAKLPEDTLNGLLADPVALGNILRYHVISGAVDAATVVSLAGQSVPTLADASDNYIDITVVDGGVVLNGVTNVIQADIIGSNGIIHAIDSVLLPPTPETKPMPMTIVEVAIASGQFTTLVTALGVAGLADYLSGAGPFTVLAPTDDAFAKLPEDTLNGLLADPVALGNVLRYHVISGAVDAATVVSLDGQSVPTLADASDNYIGITVVDGGVVLHDSTGVANVVFADISGSNGIIHAIDRVLIPGCPSTGCP